MLLPVEIFNKIITMTNNCNFIIPLEEYLEKSTIKKLLNNIKIEDVARSGNIELMKFMLERNYEPNWLAISVYPNLTEEFIREFSNELDWFYISEHELSESFIKEFSHKVNWNKIWRYQSNLSNSFIIEFRNHIEWNYLYEYHNISNSLESYIKKITQNISS